MQIFHRSTNTISKVSIFGAVFLVAGLLGLFDKINRSSWVTEAQVPREQPNPVQARTPRRRQWPGLPVLPFVGRAVVLRGHPPTRTCMTCHSQNLFEQSVSRTGARELPHGPLD